MLSKIDNGTLKSRVAGIELELRNQGLDALVLYANGSVLGNQSRMHGYMRYFCDYDSRNIPAILILRPGRAPTLLTGNPNAAHNRSDTTDKSLWFEDVRHRQANLLGEEVVAVFSGKGNGTRRIAYMGYNETPAPVWKALETGLPGVEWVHDFAAHIDRYRVQKNELELSFHRRAAEICDAMFLTVEREIRAGKQAFQVQAAMEHTARDEGCEYCQTWLTVSPQADFCRFVKDECLRVPQAGDQVLAGIYIIYEGHWGHAVRTGNLGKPAAAHQRIYDQTREMLEAALDRLRPGEDLYEVNAAMTRVLQKYYSVDQVRRSRAGHGLGYSYEDPIVSLAFPYAWNVKPGKPSPIAIKPGMLMELHPQIWVPSAGGAMIGDMVAVTASGYDILTKYPRDMLEW